jgi:hypothetical protein
MIIFIFNLSFPNLIIAAAVLMSYTTTASTGAIYIIHERVFSYLIRLHGDSIRHHYMASIASLNVIFTVLNEKYAVHINIRNYDRIVQYYEVRDSSSDLIS